MFTYSTFGSSPRTHSFNPYGFSSSSSAAEAAELVDTAELHLRPPSDAGLSECSCDDFLRRKKDIISTQKINGT